jgi:hypothetical protein
MISTASRCGCELWPDPPVHHRAPDNRGIRRMKIDGHCHCGQISFEAEVDPKAVTICHCTDWQRLTGSAFRANISAPAAHFVLRSGTPKSYVKTAESGNRRRMPSAMIAARPSMPARWTIPRAIPCAWVRSRSVRPSHRSGRSGGVLRSIGWTRSPPCRRPKGGDALSAATPSHCLTVSFLHLLVV